MQTIFLNLFKFKLWARVLVMLPLLWSVTLFAHATDLIEAWEAASAYDTELAAAQLQHQATSEHANQASGLWRPNVFVQGSIGKAAQNSKTRNASFSAPRMGQAQGVNFDTSINNGNYSGYGVQVEQPLIDLKRKAKSQQLRHSSQQADIAWQIAKQDAMLRTSQNYFAVLLAKEQLDVLKAQQVSVATLLKQAQAKFESGAVSILDTHEAKARLGQINSELELAHTKYEVAKLNFQQNTGLDAQGLRPIKTKPSILLVRPKASLNEYQAKNEQTAPEMQYAMLSINMAQDTAASLKPNAQANLNLVGYAGRSHISGNGDFGHAANSSNSWSIGLELKIPIYTGGLRNSKYREALAKRDSLAIQANSTLHKLNLVTQELWLNLDTGPARIKDLDLAYQASLARQKAIQLGVDTGSRTFVDQLNAERDVANTKLALTQAFAQLALDQMRLQAISGQLDENVLLLINQALQD